ncbi:MAG: hypothetical protein WCS27_12820 [Victivallaceae bacterium]
MEDIEAKVRNSLKNACIPQERVVPSASSRYLDLAEKIARQTLAWQDDGGRIIDPYKKNEVNTITARFLGTLGLLIMQGRCRDLIEPCAKALTPALEDLFYIRTNWGEFIVKEACMAYMAIKDAVPKDMADYWQHLLADYGDPELAYARTFTNNPSGLQNFCTFAIAGEAFRQKLGLANNQDFMDRYLEQQLTLFDKNGMYNDPQSPITYDMVSRMNLSLARWAGYQGKYSEVLDEILRLGALTQLLYQSPTGECPFGGRSNQQNFNEVTFALICEYEAVRWKRNGDLKLAGAFKRAAALAIHSIEEYLCPTPIYFAKNMFRSETIHGGEKGYGEYGGYSLLIASQLGFAALLADNTIAEGKCPVECGGYGLVTAAGFHKVFANCRGYQLEIDTNADFHYDATGLGRIHRASVPSELGLSVPIVSEPNYLVSGVPAPHNITIGPGWQDCVGDTRWLADFSSPSVQTAINLKKENSGEVQFSVEYHGMPGCDRVVEQYRIDGEGVKITDTVQGPITELLVQIPLLQTNGKYCAEIEIRQRGFVVAYRDCTYRVECLEPEQVEVAVGTFDAPNRNGIYKVGTFKVKGNKIIYRLRLEKLD